MNTAAPVRLLLMTLMVIAGFCTARPRPNIFSYFKGLFFSSDYKEATSTTTTMEPPVAQATMERDELDVAMLKVALPAHHHTAAGDHVHHHTLAGGHMHHHTGAGEHVHAHAHVVHSHHHTPAGDLEAVQVAPHEHVHRALPVHVSELHYG